MKHSILPGLIGVMFCAGWLNTVYAAQRPDWYPSDEVVAARMKVVEQQRQAAHAYYEHQFIDQYRAVGNRSPQWDQIAIDLIQARIGQLVGDDPDASARLLLSANRAVAVRPQDPMLVYLYVLSMDRTSQPISTRRAVMRQAVDGALSSAYTGVFRFSMLASNAQACAWGPSGDLQPPNMAVAQERLAVALKYLDQVSKDKSMPVDEMRSILMKASSISLELYNDRWKWTSQVYDILVKNRGESSDLLAIKAEIFTTYAWDARGDGWASTVTEEGWRLMKERLEVAEKDVARAWELNPDDPAPAIAMINVELGQGKGRDVMEKWFRRAVAIDPTQMAPYELKRYYLEGKWHGSDEEMLGFAREVAAGVPKTSPVRMILFNAHEVVATRLGNDLNQDEKVYFKQNPDAWREIKAVGDDLVMAKGTSNSDKTTLVRVAANAGDLATAQKYLAVTDEDLAYSMMGPQFTQLKSVVKRGP